MTVDAMSITREHVERRAGHDVLVDECGNVGKCAARAPQRPCELVVLFASEPMPPMMKLKLP
jgi:hypothetical protein